MKLPYFALTAIFACVVLAFCQPKAPAPAPASQKIEAPVEVTPIAIPLPAIVVEEPAPAIVAQPAPVPLPVARPAKLHKPKPAARMIVKAPVLEQTPQYFMGIRAFPIKMPRPDGFQPAR